MPPEFPHILSHIFLSNAFCLVFKFALDSVRRQVARNAVLLADGTNETAAPLAIYERDPSNNRIAPGGYLRGNYYRPFRSAVGDKTNF